MFKKSGTGDVKNLRVSCFVSNIITKYKRPLNDGE